MLTADHNADGSPEQIADLVDECYSSYATVPELAALFMPVLEVEGLRDYFRPPE